MAGDAIDHDRDGRADASSAARAHELGDRLKHAFRMHPAGIALITAATATGPVGLTASSVASVAVDPAALSFSVTRATGTAGALLATPTFAVHFLAEQHAALAHAFARSGAPRFTPEQEWSRLPTGEPYLPDAPAVLRCRPLHTLPVGSSTLVVAEVLDVILGPDDAPPLLYRDRTFLRLGSALER
jgi:flavin reductase (DIM6/NTAB) family NADH-FMN oxidoreductase RutF